MILHVTFSDGANPWVSLPTDYKTIKKLWKSWDKNQSSKTQITARHRDWKVIPGVHRGFYLFKTNINGYPISTPKYYDHLGHALRALDKIGGIENV